MTRTKSSQRSCNKEGNTRDDCSTTKEKDDNHNNAVTSSTTRASRRKKTTNVKASSEIKSSNKQICTKTELHPSDNVNNNNKERTVEDFSKPELHSSDSVNTENEIIMEDSRTTILKLEDFEKDPYRSLSQSDIKSAYWPKTYDSSNNIVHYLNNLCIGRPTHKNRKAIEKTYISSPLENFEVIHDDKSFDSRVTTVDWHPKQTNLITVGSKHGDVVFYRIGKNDTNYFEETGRIQGTGPGGYVSALKFHPEESEKFYTSSLCGKVCLWNAVSGKEEKIMLNTLTWDNWFCSLDVHKYEDLVVSGRSTGLVYLQTRQGENIWEKKLHKGKVTHAEFSPCDPALLCTASIDHTVKLWDMRMINEKKPLACLKHDKGINSAYFSQTDGSRLLTTDQFDAICVFKAPFWQLETSIKHPHRFFQHLTPLKAHWHPLTDLIICGRYPDPVNYPDLQRRCIDVFDASTGKLQCEIKDVRYDKIVSLCKFNNTGDRLLTSSGFQIQIWAQTSPPDEDFISEKENAELSKMYGGVWERSSGLIGPSRPSGRGGSGTSADKKKKRQKTQDDHDYTSTLKKKSRPQSSQNKTKDEKGTSKSSKCPPGKKPK